MEQKNKEIEEAIHKMEEDISKEDLEEIKDENENCTRKD